ncbi:Ribosomal RNA small subunit methyltransferase D, partial [Haemophilus influenzae]|jgi:hypothetical protein
VWIF